VRLLVTFSRLLAAASAFSFLVGFAFSLLLEVPLTRALFASGWAVAVVAAVLAVGLYPRRSRDEAARVTSGREP
jgi:hypothetical protein